MGFLPRTATQTFDNAIFGAVQRFQQAHGLAIDGEVGDGTRREINVPLERRLQSIVVALERERWINRPRGARHVWVNLTDFTASIVDNDVVSFQTRSVIGATDQDRQSPEFSDVMEFMVINPSWYVPRSIITKEYLPQLQRNPNAVRHLEITDSRGRQVNRGTVDFTQFTERTFPFSMRQPPSRGNALGLVKFMFPNQYNIYLHDTPAKNLFSRETRAYSHGCIRLNDPFDFAYALLAKQSSDPQGFFQSRLSTNQESRVDLNDPVPVHIVYRTAFTSATGELHFRRDVYGRDARIWNALAREGVAVRAVLG
jgi:murein L,D-transpeptidase YcbB/YkuD